MGYLSWPISRKRLIETKRHLYQSLAQAGFNKKSFIKIGSLYNELLQSEGTVPNDQKSRVLLPQSQNWPSKPAKTLYKVYIFGIYVRRAIQSTNFVTRNDKIQSFKVVYRMVSTASEAKIEVKFTGQFLKNGWTKKNPLSTVGCTAWDTHHIKKWARSVHSSRSYSNYKVPYQMTKKARWPPFRAKIDNLSYIKYHIEYIWGYSPLTEDSKTLTFVGQIQFFVVPKFGSPRVARKFDFFQI